MNDEPVRRVNQLTTTFLDTLAVLLFAAGVGWALWVEVGPAAGLSGAGLVIFVFSLLAQRQAIIKVRAAEPDDRKPLPGPADPGNLHVMGR
jgi:hypothetical protein